MLPMPAALKAQMVHCLLRPHWMPAFREGKLSFRRPGHLAAVLNETGGREALTSLKELLDGEKLDRGTRSAAIAAILAVGDPDDLRAFGLDTKRFRQDGRYDAALHAEALGRLAEVARLRNARPSGDLAASLGSLIERDDAGVRAGALNLAGTWKVAGTEDAVLAAARNGSLSVPVREAAFGALVALKTPSGPAVLQEFTRASHPVPLRAAAIRALASVDAALAAERAAELFAAGGIISRSFCDHCFWKSYQNYPINPCFFIF